MMGSVCGKCGLKLTVGGLWGYFTATVRRYLAERLGVFCPHCRTLIPAFQSTCPGCGQTLTVDGAFKVTLGPHRRRFHEMVAPTRTNKRLFQWAYLLFSALVFWMVLGLLEKHYAESWALHALLSVVYLAVLLLVSLWVVPQKAFRAIARTASKPIKLALVFNYLTGLLALQMYLTAWWSRSLMLAGLFVASWFGAWLFVAFLWPMSNVIGAIFAPPEAAARPHNPRSRQGRTVTED